MKKSQSRKRIVLLVFALLLVRVGLSCFMWVHKEQNQYALNRQLIEALVKDDSKQALALVNAGANPNTRYMPMPAPSWPELVNQWLRHSPPPANNSATALMFACGAVVAGKKRQEEVYISLSEAQLSPLLQAMLVHGANPNAKSGSGWTALHWLTMLHPSKEIAQQLLTAGADPDSVDVGSKTPLMVAEQFHHSDLVALLRKYSKHR